VTLLQTADQTGVISVVIPAYNYARYLGDALDSVWSQSRSALDVIVVDDASDDDPAPVVRRYGDRVRYVRQPRRQGPGASINCGVAHARGEFLTFLDADDTWPPGRLDILWSALHRGNRPDAVFGQAEEFWSPEVAEADRSGPPVRRIPAIVAGGLMIRRSTFQHIGPLAEGVMLGDFMDWYARALDAQLRIDVESSVVLRRRLHANNLGRRERGARADYVRLLKRSLDRRRAAGMLPPVPPA
jgi:glycosyltransferase involved in cell wall biosynthesis